MKKMLQGVYVYAMVGLFAVLAYFVTSGVTGMTFLQMCGVTAVVTVIFVTVVVGCIMWFDLLDEIFGE